MEVHVVSKTDNQEHAVAVLDSPEDNNSSLSESSVRVRPLLISLTSNNLSYARAGDFLHWWDTFPVPAQLPAPYNDRSSWGIVPAWGYGVVTESTTDITPGTLLWGFWPTASMPVSLRLQRSEPAGHWTEISESRQRLMTIYNAYIEEGRIDFPDSASGNRLQSNIDISSLVGEEKLNHMSWISLFRPVWQTGYLLSRHTFTSSPASRPPIHPLGMNLPWTAADADISASAVVSLSASGKTARSFAYNIFQRSAVEGPVGFLQVSQTPEALDPVAGILGAKIPTKAVRYDQAGESMEWIGNLRPERNVIVDFGARAGTLAQLVEDIRGHSALEGVKTTIVKVGSEQKVYSSSEIHADRESMQKTGAIQFNTSGVRDAAVKLASAKDYHTRVQPVWEDWVCVSHEIVPDIQVRLGRGVSGDAGIENGWSRLCLGSVGTQEGLVYVLT